MSCSSPDSQAPQQRKRPRDDSQQPKQPQRPSKEQLFKSYGDSESYITHQQVQGFALQNHILTSPRGKVDEPPRCIGQTHLALLTDIKPLVMMKKKNRHHIFDSLHPSNRVHALQRSLYSTPMLLHAKDETDPLSLDQLMFRNRLVPLSFCALRDDWPERFLHASSFISNQNASMLSREQSAMVVISLESHSCSAADKRSIERLSESARMQRMADRPDLDNMPEEIDGKRIKRCNDYAPQMLQPPQRSEKTLHPHKSCFVRVNDSSSYAPKLSAGMTSSEIDRHCAAAAAMRFIKTMETRDQAAMKLTDLVTDDPKHPLCVPDQSYAHLYNAVPQLLLLVSDSNLEMLSVFVQVFAAARLPLGTVLFQDARRMQAVGPALDSTLLQRAALDRLPCFANPLSTPEAHKQRSRISRITQHSDRQLQLHTTTRMMLLKHPMLCRSDHLTVVEHKQVKISGKDYTAQFNTHLTEALEPEVRDISSLVRQCAAQDQRFCVSGVKESKRLMRQASEDALDTWRRVFILPQRHDMYHTYLDSQQFGLRLAATLSGCPHSLHTDAWAHEVALCFRSVLLVMPQLLGFASLACSKQRLMDWWLTADRTAHYIDHISHRREERKVRDTGVGHPEFSLMRVFERFALSTPVKQASAGQRAPDSLGIDAAEIARLSSTPSDPVPQHQTPLQGLAEHASSQTMMQLSATMDGSVPPLVSPPQLDLHPSSISAVKPAHKQLHTAFGSPQMYSPLPALASCVSPSPLVAGSAEWERVNQIMMQRTIASLSSPSNNNMQRSALHMLAQQKASI